MTTQVIIQKGQWYKIGNSPATIAVLGGGIIQLRVEDANGNLLLPSTTVGNSVYNSSFMVTIDGIIYARTSGGYNQVILSVTPEVVEPPVTLPGGIFFVPVPGPTGPAGEKGDTGETGPSAFFGTSNSSVAIGTGVKTFTTQVDLDYFPGERLRVAYDETHYMEGVVQSYSSTTLTINVDIINSSGTYATWNIGPAGERGANGATGAQGPAGNPGATGAPGVNGQNGSLYYATSSTSIAIGTGSKEFSVQSGLSFFAGQRLRCAHDETHWMEGPVTSYLGTTCIINVDMTSFNPGTYNSWSIGPCGEPSMPNDAIWIWQLKVALSDISLFYEVEEGIDASPSARERIQWDNGSLTKQGDYLYSVIATIIGESATSAVYVAAKGIV